MQTASEEYEQHLRKKYHRGRGLYLRFCLYPKYLRALGDLRGREIVDLGCGNGEFLKYCRTRGIPAFGVDSNKYLVAQCRDLGLEVVLADILTYVPGEGKQLANLVCDNVVEHLSTEEIDLFFQNLKRIVAPGGKLLVVVPGKKGFPKDPTHKTLITAEVMGDVCRRYSLAMEKMFHLPINLRVAGDYFYLNMAVFTVVF